MRSLKKGRFARTMASLLILLFVGPLLSWILLLPAAAQITTATKLQQVAIVPFQNVSKGGDASFADKATNAVAQALLDTQIFDVRPVEDSKQNMADLGLRSPLTEAALERLGSAMGVGGIVFGEVRSAGIQKLSRSSRGQVTLMVAIYDVPTGIIRNGVITTGQSSEGYSDVSPDKLVEEALNQAAYQAMKEIQSHRQIDGIVTNAKEKSVSLSIGGNVGVRPTMKFVVLREGQRVGVMQVDRIEQTFSDGHLVEGQVRLGDHVAQIVEIPAKGTYLDVPGERTGKKQGEGKLILALLAGLLLLGMTKSSGGTGAAAGVSASAVANAAATSVFTVPDDGGGPVLNPIPGPGALVQLHWNAPTGTNELVAGYEIWCDGSLYGFSTGAGQFGRTWFDPLSDVVGNETITIQIEPESGVIARLDNFFGDPTKFGKTADPAKPISTYSVDSVHPTTLSYFIGGDFVQKTYADNNTYAVYVGHYGGQHHVYQVRKVVSRRYQTITGDYLWELYRTTLPGRAVTATLVGLPALQFPLNDEAVADPTSVSFGFNPPPGVDDYIFQVSLDSQFASSATKFDNLTLLDGIHAPTDLLTITENLVTLLGSLPTGTNVFWRIGSRWRGDTTMPQNYPQIGKTPSDSYRYVFSETRQLEIQ
jgi:hypothetical protein